MLVEFEDDAKSESGSSMSEYGWETDSDDELGTPTRRRPEPKASQSANTTPSKRPSVPPPPRPPAPAGRPSTKPPRPPGPNLPGKQKDGRSLEEYMDMMDRELAQTEVGKSFVRESQPVPKPRKKRQVSLVCRQHCKQVYKTSLSFNPLFKLHVVY